MNPDDLREKSIRIRTVSDYFSRMKGLIGTPPDELGCDAIHIKPCRSVHTFGMKYPIDLAFVSADGTILGIRKCVEPNQICSSPSGTRSIVERPSSALPWLEMGEAVIPSASDRADTSDTPSKPDSSLAEQKTSNHLASYTISKN